jgi:hypothetical protein
MEAQSEFDMRLCFILLFGCLAAPSSAQIYTTPTPYCGGRLVAELFDTQVTPGPQGRVDYSMRLHNPGDQALRFQVQVVGEMLNRPTGQFAIPPQQRLSMALGYSLNAPGRQPLRGEALANAVRISCL